MAALLSSPAPDYTQDSFDSLRARLISLLTSVLPDLDLDSIAELATLLLETNAWIGDVLSYYLNATGREARITTATQRRGLLGLVKLLGFRVPGAVAASVTETFTLSAIMTGDVTFPAGTLVQTPAASPIAYQLLAPLTIPAGQTIGSATVENSTPQSDTFTSTGASNQQFLLTQTPYVDGSLQWTDAASGPYDSVENPSGWREVTNFLSSAATDRVYTTTVDNLDRCLVTFGNGVTGAIPTGTCSGDYKTGGGAAGTVAANALTILPGAWTDSLSNIVPSVSVTNLLGASPGADRFSVAQIQQLAPAAFAMQGRAVDNPDFETGANLVPGVLRTLFLTATEDPSIPWGSGMGFVLPTGGGQPTPTTLQRVRAQFEPVIGYPQPPPYPKLNAFPVQWCGVEYLIVNASALLYLRAGAIPSTVGAAIRAALASFLAPTLVDGSLNPAVDFGYNYQDQNGTPTGTFAWSDLFDLVASVAGVLKVDPGASGFLLNGARSDVTIGLRQFPQLGSVVLVNATTGQAF